jgi:hypothetical protein
LPVGDRSPSTHAEERAVSAEHRVRSAQLVEELLLSLGVAPSAGVRAICQVDDPEQLRLARRRACLEVGRLGLRVQPDLVALTVSELATNALLHGDPPAVVAVGAFDADVLVAVFDRSSRPPRLQHPSDTDIGGRGVLVVDGAAERWGVVRVTQGKWVWCIVSAEVDHP